MSTILTRVIAEQSLNTTSIWLSSISPWKSKVLLLQIEELGRRGRSSKNAKELVVILIFFLSYKLQSHTTDRK